MRIKPLLCVLLCAAAGCASFDGERVRREHVESFRAASAEVTEEELSAREPLDLRDCVEVALRRSLRVRQAETEASIARLERRVAFANFLPVIEASAGVTSMDRQPMRRAGEDASGDPMYVAFQDRTVRTGSVDLQWSIFRPSTWFLYSARRRGEEIGALMRDFTAQRIRMEVTAQYYRCLSLREALRAAETELHVAKELSAGAEAHRREGLLSEEQSKEAGLYRSWCETNLDRTRTDEKLARSDLMVLMGLLPTRPPRLEEGAPLKAPEMKPEEMITRALLAHPQLRASDREVAINRQMVKAAVADFLPSLLGFGGVSYSSDSFTKYSTSWSGGFSGVMTLFNGFASVNNYRIEREREKAAWLRREEMCLTVMLQVMRARGALEDARRDAALAERNLELASLRLANARARSREGLASPEDLLRAVSRRAAAERDRRLAGNRVQVGIAALFHAMGVYGKEAGEGDGGAGERAGRGSGR